jgi:hypothetical protein
MLKSCGTKGLRITACMVVVQGSMFSWSEEWIHHGHGLLGLLWVDMSFWTGRELLFYSCNARRRCWIPSWVMVYADWATAVDWYDIVCETISIL